MEASYNGVAIEMRSRNVIVDKMRSRNSVAMSISAFMWIQWITFKIEKFDEHDPVIVWKKILHSACEKWSFGIKYLVLKFENDRLVFKCCVVFELFIIFN